LSKGKSTGHFILEKEYNISYQTNSYLRNNYSGNFSALMFCAFILCHFKQYSIRDSTQCTSLQTHQQLTVTR